LVLVGAPRLRTIGIAVPETSIRIPEHRLEALMDALGRAARHPARIYFTGGATAVLFAWRASTVDVDPTLDPEHDELYRAIATLKDPLRINVELASPAHSFQNCLAGESGAFHQAVRPARFLSLRSLCTVPVEDRARARQGS
jgi:hypothetical protein